MTGWSPRDAGEAPVAMNARQCAALSRRECSPRTRGVEAPRDLLSFHPSSFLLIQGCGRATIREIAKVFFDQLHENEKHWKMWLTEDEEGNQ